jgi:hypothetical protein
MAWDRHKKVEGLNPKLGYLYEQKECLSVFSRYSNYIIVTYFEGKMKIN